MNLSSTVTPVLIAEELTTLLFGKGTIMTGITTVAGCYVRNLILPGALMRNLRIVSVTRRTRNVISAILMVIGLASKVE